MTHHLILFHQIHSTGLIEKTISNAYIGDQYPFLSHLHKVKRQHIPTKTCYKIIRTRAYLNSHTCQDIKCTTQNGGTKLPWRTGKITVNNPFKNWQQIFNTLLSMALLLL